MNPPTELIKAIRTWYRSDQYRSFKSSELQELPGWGKVDPAELEEALIELENRGELVFLFARGWFATSRENWFVGTLSIARKGFGFVRSLVVDPRGDVFIPIRRLRDAHHGDRVLVALESRRKGHQEYGGEGRSGKILEVIERSPRVFPGYYREVHGGAGVVEPARHESVRVSWILHPGDLVSSTGPPDLCGRGGVRAEVVARTCARSSVGEREAGEKC